MTRCEGSGEGPVEGEAARVWRGDGATPARRGVQRLSPEKGPGGLFTDEFSAGGIFFSFSLLFPQSRMKLPPEFPSSLQAVGSLFLSQLTSHSRRLSSYTMRADRAGNSSTTEPVVQPAHSVGVMTTSAPVLQMEKLS